MTKFSTGFRNFAYKAQGSFDKLPLPGAQKLSPSSQTVQRTLLVRTGTGAVNYTDTIGTIEQKTLEIVYLPESFLVDILGYQISDGTITEPILYRPKHFSLFYETQTDTEPIRTQLFDVVCGKPEFDVTSITNRLNVDVRRLALTLNPELKAFSPQQPFGGYSRSVKRSDNAEAFDTWWSYGGTT